MDISNSHEHSDEIRSINRDTVHRICSGQVVLSLAIAVKELVENAIDAGATIIDVRLKEYGSDLIEVSDNGSGVKEINFQALTLKHYTSKITEFNDLEHIKTLGFRGEALSSLCALSDLTVITKHYSEDHATRITYDHNGKIIEKKLEAREQGTSVILENLFSCLVVRRKEFIKNLKREFNKMCLLLYAYCLVSKGIKITCTNSTKTGQRNTIVSTEGSDTVKDNILNIFGPKQLASLIEVDISRPEEDILAEYGLKLVEGEDLFFTFELFISSVMHGSGRSSSDRQFFYINSRPCDPSKISKVINEVYRQYNSNQYPFVYLNVITKSSLVDVNVTPDKRQVFLEKEKHLLATIKASLIEAFRNFPSTFKMQNLDVSQNTTIMDFFTPKRNRGLKRSLTESVIKKGSILQKFQKRSKTENDKKCEESPIFSPNDSIEVLEVEDSVEENLVCLSKVASSLINEQESCDNSAKVQEKIACNFKRAEKEREKIIRIKEVNQVTEVETIESVHQPIGDDPNNVSVGCGDLRMTDNDKSDLKTKANVSKIDYRNIRMTGSNKIDLKTKEKVSKNEIQQKISFGTKIYEKPNVNKLEQSLDKESFENSEIEDEEESKFDEHTIRDDLEIALDVEVERTDRKSIVIDASIEKISQSLAKRTTKNKNEDVKVRFRSQIAPESNKAAEAELQKQISKENFKEMEVIGQFNLGFIITKLKNDLFIVDQHATDEKYNFEQLQATTVLEQQVLVNPKPLQLTAGNETLLIENEEIFKKNGFTFKIDPLAPCTQKISLTSIPLSKNVVFGKDDIDEMLFMLQDCPQTMYRPARISGMLASRACRKSVMIGKALAMRDMMRLIDHMGEIEQPWNCPHGRPTMRHLINLDLIHEQQ